MTRRYEIQTTFNNILSLYQFDDALRQLTFGYLNKIELKVQNLISDSFCSTFGDQQSAYLDPQSYSKDPKHRQGIQKLIKILHGIAVINTDHEYLVHQRRKYHEVPLWVATHAMTFGQISNLYLFLCQKEKRKVALAYPNVSEKALEQYLSALTLFRNTCAHEERLFSFRLVIYGGIGNTLWEMMGHSGGCGSGFFTGERSFALRIRTFDSHVCFARAPRSRIRVSRAPHAAGSHGAAFAPLAHRTRQAATELRSQLSRTARDRLKMTPYSSCRNQSG